MQSETGVEQPKQWFLIIVSLIYYENRVIGAAVNPNSFAYQERGPGCGMGDEAAHRPRQSRFIEKAVSRKQPQSVVKHARGI